MLSDVFGIFLDARKFFFIVSLWVIRPTKEIGTSAGFIVDGLIDFGDFLLVGSEVDFLTKISKI